MNKALWIAQKHTIWNLLKKLSKEHGGDEESWLIGYAKELVDFNTDNLTPVIEALQDMLSHLRFKAIKKPTPLVPEQ